MVSSVGKQCSKKHLESFLTITHVPLCNSDGEANILSSVSVIAHFACQ